MGPLLYFVDLSPSEGVLFLMFSSSEDLGSILIVFWVSNLDEVVTNIDFFSRLFSSFSVTFSCYFSFCDSAFVLLIM